AQARLDHIPCDCKRQFTDFTKAGDNWLGKRLIVIEANLDTVALHQEVLRTREVSLHVLGRRRLQGCLELVGRDGGGSHALQALPAHIDLAVEVSDLPEVETQEPVRRKKGVLIG